MKALDVLVVPSHYEGFGLVAVEGMAAGTAIVASRVSSLPEIVRDGIEGSLILPKDAHALASALIHLANEPELRTRMGEAGQARAKQCYAQEHMLDAHEALLSGIVVGQA
jgi:glycosyltransferase involved in cell wall biosynthesis